VPVKSFAMAKARLAGALSAQERRDLAREMASTVVHAAGDLPVHVVCDDEDVAAWARLIGAVVLWKPGHGLNGAVTDGVAELAALGFERAVIAHADLPHAVDFDPLMAPPGDDIVVIVPDRHADGTNVISVPTGIGFEFAYGPGSSSRHAAEARRLGLRVSIVEDARLGWDVDRPEDLVPPDWSQHP